MNTILKSIFEYFCIDIEGHHKEIIPQDDSTSSSMKRKKSQKKRNSKKVKSREFLDDLEDEMEPNDGGARNPLYEEDESEEEDEDAAFEQEMEADLQDTLSMQGCHAQSAGKF